MCLAVKPAAPGLRHFQRVFHPRAETRRARGCPDRWRAGLPGLTARSAPWGRSRIRGCSRPRANTTPLPGLVNGDREHVGYYRNGSFITLYLSPRDYHRVHLPAGGELQSMAYVPGRLFSVNPGSVRRVDGLFAPQRTRESPPSARISACCPLFSSAQYS